MSNPITGNLFDVKFVPSRSLQGEAKVKAAELAEKAQEILAKSLEPSGGHKAIESGIMQSLADHGEAYTRVHALENGLSRIEVVEHGRVKLKSIACDNYVATAYFIVKDATSNDQDGEWVPAKQVHHSGHNGDEQYARHLPGYCLRELIDSLTFNKVSDTHASVYW